jgi:hypothetical protein
MVPNSACRSHIRLAILHGTFVGLHDCISIAHSSAAYRCLALQIAQSAESRTHSTRRKAKPHTTFGICKLDGRPASTCFTLPQHQQQLDSITSFPLSTPESRTLYHAHQGLSEKKTRQKARLECLRCHTS